MFEEESDETEKEKKSGLTQNPKNIELLQRKGLSQYHPQEQLSERHLTRAEERMNTMH